MRFRIVTAVIFATVLTGSLNTPRTASAQDDIVATAVANGSFTTLANALTAADLVDALQGPGPFTVFAPNDEAFAQLGDEMLEDLLKPENREQLTTILTYHVVSGRVTASQAFGLDAAQTLSGQRLSLDRDGTRLRADNARVITTDIVCSNGIIHVIDNVLLPSLKSIPEVATEAGSFTTLLAALQAAGLDQVVADNDAEFTVFAPTDEAFAKLGDETIQTLLQPENRDQLKAILTYHVVPGRIYSDDAARVGRATTVQGMDVTAEITGDGLLINESAVVASDIQATNGVIHVIDTVLLPPKMDASAALAMLADAVGMGAPAYNRGDAHTCVRVYQKVMSQLIETGADSLPQSGINALQSAMNRAEHAGNEFDRAWILRNGIDRAVAIFRSDRRSMSTRIDR